MHVQEQTIRVNSNKKAHSTIKKREKKLNWNSRLSAWRVDLQIRLWGVLDLSQAWEQYSRTCLWWLGFPDYSRMAHGGALYKREISRIVDFRFWAYRSYMSLYDIEINLPRNGLYFDHNFFIRTLIWMIQDFLKKIRTSSTRLAHYLGHSIIVYDYNLMWFAAHDPLWYSHLSFS
jgi:hypothetical protein